VSFDDADLYFDAVAHRGLRLVESGQVTDGMRRLDEAAAAAYGGEVADRTVVGEIYCKLMVACETVLDVPRAEQWHRVFAALEQHLDVAWASAICRMHVGAVWTAAGRWLEAEQELTRSVELYDGTYRALRSAACARLADLRVRQERFGEAERLLESSGGDSSRIRPAAEVAWHHATTTTERHAAAAQLAELLARQEDSLATVPGLSALTELQLACGQIDAAVASAARLTAVTHGDVGSSLAGYARFTEGLVAMASGEGAYETLREAIRLFDAGGLPLQRARAQSALAQTLATSDPGAALSEARQAAETFASIGAVSDYHSVSRLIRSLGAQPSPRSAPAASPLTAREDDVLTLLAEGLSNPQIAERLFISRRTVAHHVSSVLSKLGVRNRAEATAWRFAHGSQRGSAQKATGKTT
jgi:DNA-binding NarL/FixJ family response regulator